MQGLLQAAQPEIQAAYASHWLAARQAAAAPGFQQLSQNMMMGLYGATALSGLLRYALSGRATPEVVGGIVDQVNLIQNSYQGAQESLQQFLGDETVQDLSGVQLMSRTLPQLDRFHQQMQQPAQTVLNDVQWSRSGTLPGWPIERALVGFGEDGWQEAPQWERGQGQMPEGGAEHELPPPDEMGPQEQ